MKVFWWVCVSILMLLTLTSTVHADTVKNDLGNNIDNGKCLNLQKGDIPFGSFNQIFSPLSPLTINQYYNTSYAQGYWNNGQWMFGHDGLDLAGASPEKGKNDIRAILSGKVVLSLRNAGWGESIILAVRPSQYSEEIITHHYHHMDNNGLSDANYRTTRRFGVCATVNSEDVLGKEGTTGNSKGPHLHLSIRRWKNFNELMNALKKEDRVILGRGYVFKHTEYLANYLDPFGVLFDTYQEFEDSANPSPYDWAKGYALQMRYLGIEFGLYDGKFGLDQNVKRREAARWIKIGSERPSLNSVQHFQDVPSTDPDFPYIETLADPLSTWPVINPYPPSGNFYPDQDTIRAQAIKMVVLAFYLEDFFGWYLSLPLAPAPLVFQDVHFGDWYWPYVAYGLQKGFIASSANFYPNTSIVRAEMAKWVILGHNYHGKMAKFPCGQPCPNGKFCHPDALQCLDIPPCVPSETVKCNLGGGFCVDGSTMSCGLCGVSVCQNGQYGDCQSQGVCAPGDMKSQSCNGNGLQSATCANNCQWGAWNACNQNPATCFDNIQNQGETGVDCGGPCPPCGPIDLASNLGKPYDLTLDANFVYWIEQTNPGTLRKVAKAGGSFTTLASDLTNPTALIASGNYVYVVETQGAGNGKIRRFPVNGGNGELVTSGLTTTENLVTDGSKLFFGDYNANLSGMVKSCPLQANAPISILVSGLGQYNTAMTVDSSFVYFSDGNEQILRSNKDGSNLTTLGTAFANALKVDNAKLYFTGGSIPGGSVSFIPKGGGSESVLAPATVSQPYDLALDANFVYWIERDSGGSVNRISVNGGNVKKYSDYGGTIGIEVDDTFVYWAESFQVNAGKIRRAPK